MNTITITREQMLAEPLDRERDELLSILAEEKAHLRERKFLQVLLVKRLNEIEAERQRLGLPQSDAADYAEMSDYADHLDRNGGGVDEEED